MRRLLLVVVALVCCLPMAQAVPSSATPGASAASALSVSPATAALPAAAKKASCWTGPRPTCRISNSLLFNSATGSYAVQNRIHGHIVNTINRTPNGSEIFIMSWNVMSKPATTALINAQRRGVKVLILMDAVNFTRTTPNPQWNRLRNSLSYYNRYFPAWRSWALTCDWSCRRNVGGSAHSKFFLFSQVGATKNVVMHGSANLTSASVTNQWNDLITFTENLGLFNFSKYVFYQMFSDRAVFPTYVSYNRGNYGLLFSPRVSTTGRISPAVEMLEINLSRVGCVGAVNGNRYHRTVIRAFPDVIRGMWGDRIARHLKRLWDHGCDVKVGYTILGKSTGNILKARSGRGPVPLRHMASDKDGDGDFDRYFHMKSWTINGVLNGDTSAYWTMHGSSNISDNSAVSDENIGWFTSPAITMAFQNHMDYWFAHPPRSRPLIPSKVPANLDPYQHMEKDY